MTDRPFPGESAAPHRGLRQYPPVPSAPGTHLGGYGGRSHMWPQQAMIQPPLPRGGPSLPRPVPMQFNHLHMAGRMPPQASHFPLPPQMTHQPNGNLLSSLNNMHRRRELLSMPWQQPMNALHGPRSAPFEGACGIDEEAELRSVAHLQPNEPLAAGRGIEERASNAISEASVIVRKGPAATGEMSRTMHYPRRCASDESAKFRSTSVIVNNRSASPRGTAYPISTPTPTWKGQPTQPIQHLPNLGTGVSSISFSDNTAATSTPIAYSTSDATTGVAKDLFVIATSTSPVASSAVLSTASSVTPPTTRGATAATLSNIATSSSVAPPISASSNVIAPPTGSAPTTILACTAPRPLPTEPAALQTTSSMQLSAATETTVLSTRPVATPSTATPPSFTSSSLSASLSTVGATMHQPHPSHPRVSSALVSAAKQSHLQARPVTVDAKPITENPRALDSTLSTSDQRVSCRTEETKSVVVDRPTCDAGYDSGPLGKDSFLQGTLCSKKRPASLLDCQSNAVSSTVKHEDKDNMLSSCKRFVIASPGSDATLELPMETQDNPRISPHPSGSAASDDSDITFDLDFYDEDEDRCNHSNLEMVSGECVVADANSMRVCTKCQKLVLKNGEKERVVDLSQGDRSYIRAYAPSTASHGETPREYLIPPDMHTLLQSRREYMSDPVYPLATSRIINLVYPPVHSAQNSTLTCYKMEQDGGEGIRTDVPTIGKYKNGKQNRTSKASSRMKKGTAKSVIMPDSTDEASAMSGDCDSVVLSDCSAEGPTSAQRSSITGDSPSSSHLMDVESVPDVAEYSPAGSEQGRWSMNEVSELGAGLDTQTLELLQDFSPADVAQWKKLKVKRSTGETPLHQACSRGLMPMAKYFLQIERVCPNVQDNAGWTSLHEACSHRHHSVARLLLDHGANPSVCAHDGTMPIHDAVEANDLAGVKLLVEYGASIAPESGERLPLEIAKSKGFLSIVEYLQELMDMSSRAEVKSAKGHTSQSDGTYFEDAKLAGQSYKLDEFRLGPELDYPLFLLSPFFDECEQTIPVAFNIRVPNESSGRRHNFYLMDDLVKVSGLSEANVRTALQETGLNMHVMTAPEFRAQVKTSEIYTIPRNLRNSHKQVELVPDCSVMRDLLGIRRVDIEQ